MCILKSKPAEGIALYEEFYGRYLVQGVQDKVNAYILEQQTLAEAAEKAAAEAEFAAELAAQASEAEAAAKAMAELEAARLEATSANRHFLEPIAVLGILAAVTVLSATRKKYR